MEMWAGGGSNPMAMAMPIQWAIWSGVLIAFLPIADDELEVDVEGWAPSMGVPFWADGSSQSATASMT